MKPSSQAALDESAHFFSKSAQKLCGQMALILGWRPTEFWESTPHEIAIILSANQTQNITPVDRDTLNQLLQIEQSKGDKNRP